jgi:hypothetical protein
VAGVFVLASFGLARLDRPSGVFPFEDLHARLFVRTDNQPALLIELGSIHVQLAYFPGLLVEVRVMAVEPIDALVRLQSSSSKIRQTVERLIAS